jgi:uncharacterized protein YjiS (DUF1127 family)
MEGKMKTMYGTAGASPALGRGPKGQAGIGHVLTSVVTRGFELLLIWQEREFQRRALEGLDDHALRDIGLSRADVVREADKPFWRA